jgi:hypothetical protein
VEARFWAPIFQDAGEEIDVVAPMPEAKLAARSAQRCAAGPATSLLPPEFATRYRQQFVDGLWIRGGVSVLCLYVAGVLIYFGMLYAQNLTYDHVKRDLAGIGQSYTNAMKDSAQLQILEDRSALKFAALDCWRALAENLPESVSLDDMYFDRQKFELHGTALSADQDAVLKFNEDMRRAANPARPDQLLFAEVLPPRINIRGDKLEWQFTCNLKETGND